MDNPTAIVAMTEDQFEAERAKGTAINAASIHSGEESTPLSSLFGYVEQRWTDVPWDQLSFTLNQMISMKGNTGLPLAVIDPDNLRLKSWSPLTPFEVWEEQKRL